MDWRVNGGKEFVKYIYIFLREKYRSYRNKKGWLKEWSPEKRKVWDLEQNIHGKISTGQRTMLSLLCEGNYTVVSMDASKPAGLVARSWGNS